VNNSSFLNSHMEATPPIGLMPRKTPRQARSEATVEAVFDATIQVLVAEGPRRLTTTRVAERAGVSVGTMYQYFPHRNALLYAVIERYLNEVAEKVERACASNEYCPVEQGVDALVTTYVDAKSAQADAARALYSVSAEIDVAGLVKSTFQRFHRAAVKMLISAPDARFEDIDQLVFTLLAAIAGATRIVFEGDATPFVLLQFREQMRAMALAYVKSASRL
jgi:AcrR family transcriptional regulator